MLSSFPIHQETAIILTSTIASGVNVLVGAITVKPIQKLALNMRPILIIVILHAQIDVVMIQCLMQKIGEELSSVKTILTQNFIDL